MRENELLNNRQKISFRQFFEKYGMLWVLLLFCLILSIVSDSFLTFNNWQNLIRQVCVNGILALGMTFVILTGGIDLSVGPLCAVSGVVAAKYMVDHPEAPIIIPILLAFAVCMIFGIFYGSIISWSGLPPFVVTLAVMQIARGLALAYTDGKPIIIKNQMFRFLGQGKLFEVIPIPVIFFLVIFLYSLFIQRNTKFGRYIYAIGGNEAAAKASGVNVKKYRTLVYIQSACFVSIAGILLAARTQSGQPAVGTSYECDAIAAVVIGGTSMSGGIGGVEGTLIGILIIGVINNGLNLMGVSSHYQTVAKGLIILIAVLVDVITKKANRK
ncbi:MAG: ABC transporter permease [Acholeplasmataceae bacterium]|nr:ABC transporter permease [Acholeplasmataceae bacterium]